MSKDEGILLLICALFLIAKVVQRKNLTTKTSKEKEGKKPSGWQGNDQSQ
jgi:hypothetical protein